MTIAYFVVHLTVGLQGKVQSRFAETRFAETPNREDTAGQYSIMVDIRGTVKILSK